MAMPKRKNIDVLLGIFVVAGILLLGISIFLIGKERHLFDRSAYIKAEFPNVVGLSVGAQVLLGGVIIGNVSDIVFPFEGSTPNGPRQLTVIMRVSNNMMPWIRSDSIARVDSKGLLGDKNINISLGSPAAASVPNNGMLRSMEPADLNRAFAEAQNILRDVTDGVAGLRKFLDGFLKEGGGEAITDAVKSLSKIVEHVQTGPGLAYNLIYDKKTAEQFTTLMGSLDATIKSTNDIVVNVNGIVSAIRTKKGLAHSLIYDERGGEIVSQLGATVAKINSVLAEVESGNGIIHTLIYNKLDSNFIDNLNLASADLVKIISSVKGGQGTIGKLLVDQSVYDDLKTLLGDVKRNELLKSLVRSAISKKEREARHPK